MAAEGALQGDILVVLFARGGADGLQLVAPVELNEYQDARPTIAVQSSGDNAGIPMANGIGGVDFFLHPDAASMDSLYTSGDLAVIHASGIPTDNRSHFKSMDMMERGLADNEPSLTSGWLTRHIETLVADRPLLSTVSTSSNNPISLLGHPQAVSIPDLENFNVAGGEANAKVISALNASGRSNYQKVALQTLEAIDTVQTKLQDLEDTRRVDNGAEEPAYTNGPLSGSLRNLATLIKMDVGVDVATVDYGGWDHHNNLVNEFRNNANELSDSLVAFWDDMVNYRDRITVVFMTEFGRRLGENASQGTDHGAGSTMMVLSGNANGGRIYGQWPGLDGQNLKNGDLPVTTDYRRVIGEVLAKRHFSPSLDNVFPTVTYNPLGVVTGDDSAVRGAAVASTTVTNAG